MIYDSHFKIADIEKIFGDIDNNQVKRVHVIILNVRDVIYHKRKTGSKVTGRFKKDVYIISRFKGITRSTAQK